MDPCRPWSLPARSACSHSRHLARPDGGDRRGRREVEARSRSLLDRRGAGAEGPGRRWTAGRGRPTEAVKGRTETPCTVAERRLRGRSVRCVRCRLEPHRAYQTASTCPPRRTRSSAARTVRGRVVASSLPDAEVARQPASRHRASGQGLVREARLPSTPTPRHRMEEARQKGPRNVGSCALPRRVTSAPRRRGSGVGLRPGPQHRGLKPGGACRTGVAASLGLLARALHGGAPCTKRRPEHASEP
jgi:hypothetical protein